ncbi:MAG: VWA domain-containing protein, partial [Dehalococcoidia bacterium]
EDAFRGTSQPDYADGDWDSAGGYSGGGLRVDLGGVDNTVVNDMSGGWRKTFYLASQEEVVLSFDYQMTQSEDYSTNEYSEVLVTVDAMQPGAGVNDYVERIYGDGDGGPPRTTGWQTFTVNLGTLGAGGHVLTLGGYNNKKTEISESTEIFFDNASVTVTCTNCPTFLENHYDADAEGAVYLDDAFHGTNQPNYEDGWWDAAGGQTGGGLKVFLGGIDDDDIVGLSGGWQTSFNLASQHRVVLSFNYNMIQAANYNFNPYEYSDVLVAVDGVLHGTDPEDYVVRIEGDGDDNGPDKVTGWQNFTVDLGIMPAGPHSVTIGGYNNQKTYHDETVEVLIDDVLVAATCDNYCDPLLSEAFEGVVPLHVGIDSMVQGGPGLLGGTNLVQAIKGGAQHFDSGLGDRPDPPSPNILIVITDGQDNQGNSDGAIHAASMTSGAEIYAVGVGSGLPMSTLEAIATSPDNEHVFTTADYSGLVNIIDTIAAAVHQSLGEGVLISIQSVGADGTVSIFEVLLPPE